MNADEIMNKVNKDMKEVVFTKGLRAFDCEKIPFTSPKMNYITFGGLPTGRIAEFYGEEGGGKTTTTLDLCANYQLLYPDKRILYVDHECTLDPEWAEKLNVNIDELYIYQPMTESAEYVLQVMKDCIESGEYGLCVLDSYPCLKAEKDLGKELTDAERVAGTSGLITRFLREVVGLCKKFNCTFIIINQIRDKINSTIPGQTSTPGGHGIKHYATTRIEFKKGSYLDDSGKTISRSSGEPDSQKINVNMMKSKFCAPGRHIGQYTINYDEGVDYITDLIDLAIDNNIIQKSGSWFNIMDADGNLLNDAKIQGQNNVKTYLQEHDEILSTVEQLCNEIIAGR